MCADSGGSAAPGRSESVGLISPPAHPTCQAHPGSGARHPKADRHGGRFGNCAFAAPGDWRRRRCAGTRTYPSPHHPFFRFLCPLSDCVRRIDRGQRWRRTAIFRSRSICTAWSQAVTAAEMLFRYLCASSENCNDCLIFPRQNDVLIQHDHFQESTTDVPHSWQLTKND